MVKRTPMPNLKFFEWFFNSDVFFNARRTGKKQIWGFYDYFSDEPCRMATSRHRYRRLSRHFKPGARLRMLKIGPSTGTFLKVAANTRHDAIRCDVSSRFAGYAEDQYGIRIDRPIREAGLRRCGVRRRAPLQRGRERPQPARVPRGSEPRSPDRGLFILPFPCVDMKGNLLARLQKERCTSCSGRPSANVFDRDVMTRLLRQYGFESPSSGSVTCGTCMEKISTLLGWRWLHWITRTIRIHRIVFPVYAYPSRLVVARKIGGVPSAGA